jgi:hypothetical protein
MKKILNIAIVVAVAFSCSKDKDPNTIEAEFQPFVDSFNREAASRNRTVNEAGLIVGFVDQSEIQNYCGYGTFDPPHVKISTNANCWSQKTDTDKEILFFHEMGHAVLRRVHINDTLPNGDYKSMMFDGNQFNLYNGNDEQRRKYYLDELFNPGSAAPAWATKKTNPSGFYSTSFDNNTQGDWVFQNNGANIGQAIVDGSLKLQGVKTTSGFSYWAIFIQPGDQIPVGSRLVLKAKIKTEGVDEPGAYIALRGDSDQPAVFFQTTQNKNPASGTNDFTSYSIAQPYFPSLLMDGKSGGTVWFDDIELIVVN